MKRILMLLTSHAYIIAMSAQTIEISNKNTVSLVFAMPIVHIDRGNENVMVQPVKEANNICLLKCKSPDSAISNITVVTSDHAVYSFQLSYNYLPKDLVINIPPKAKASIKDQAVNLLDNPPLLTKYQTTNGGIRFQLISIYVRQQIMYFQFKLENNSPLDYEVDLLQMSLKNRQQPKRTAIQQIELKRLAEAGNLKEVKAFSKNIFVLAVDQFSLNKEQQLLIEISERNSGRLLHLKAGNRAILGAKLLE